MSKSAERIYNQLPCDAINMDERVVGNMSPSWDKLLGVPFIDYDVYVIVRHGRNNRYTLQRSHVHVALSVHFPKLNEYWNEEVGEFDAERYCTFAQAEMESIIRDTWTFRDSELVLMTVLGPWDTEDCIPAEAVEEVYKGVPVYDLRNGAEASTYAYVMPTSTTHEPSAVAEWSQRHTAYLIKAAG